MVNGINETELRVGITLNLLPFEKVGFNPVTIDKPRLIALLKGEETTYFPIPLTAEILDKCGLKNDDGYYHNEDYSFSIEERGNEYFYEYDGRNIGKGCKYLHELQNLYFALTGEELKIKELVA